MEADGRGTVGAWGRLRQTGLPPAAALRLPQEPRTAMGYVKESHPGGETGPSSFPSRRRGGNKQVIARLLPKQCGRNSLLCPRETPCPRRSAKPGASGQQDITLRPLHPAALRVGGHLPGAGFARPALKALTSPMRSPVSSETGTFTSPARRRRKGRPFSGSFLPHLAVEQG